MSRPVVRAALLLLGGVLLSRYPSPTFAADYKDVYRRGTEAARREDWAEAIRLMEEAIAEKPAEGESVRFYGQYYEDYYPYYWLGLAHANSGDCPGALTAFQTSESQGAIKKSPLYKALVRSREACGVKVTPPTPSPTADPIVAMARAAQEAISRAEAESRDLGALKSVPLLAEPWVRETPLGPSEKRARDTLSSARVKLEAGLKKTDPVLLKDAKDLAERASAEFQRVKETALRRLVELGATPAPGSTPAPPPTIAPKGPPTQLVYAARAFFGAEYGQAIDILRDVEAPPSLAAAHGLLLRSAARHALYIVGGEKDQHLLRLAEADARMCRQFAPHLRPDPLAFSPLFIQFYRQAR